MAHIDLEILDIALSGSSSGAYALVLGEVKGKRKLPIVIGGAEAQSIAIEMENMRPSRPLTHDLFRNTLSVFGMEVTEVVIHKMSEGIFYAQLVVTDGIREERIDSRSSDAVAIAVRFGCPIRCSTQVMEAAGVELDATDQDSPGGNVAASSTRGDGRRPELGRPQASIGRSHRHGELRARVGAEKANRRVGRLSIFAP